MKFANINLGKDVEIEPSTSINNVKIGNLVRIAKRCSIYGGPDNLLEIGDNSYVGMNSVLNGFAAKLSIGDNVSISQFVNIMVDSGPNASPGMMRIFPIEKGPITIGHDSWIGANAIIMPNVVLGEYCVVASNSFVNKSFPPFSIIGGTPAKLIRFFSEEEKTKMLDNNQKIFNEYMSHYETNYIDLPFESQLRKYRFRKFLDIVGRFPHHKILEIGPGPFPVFQGFSDFDEMSVVEPEQEFFNLIRSVAKKHKNVRVINSRIEDSVGELKKYSFDFIVIGGFLHEVKNPCEVLDAVRNICSENTMVYSYVPNANSLHRLLAFKMGIIESVYQKSDHDDIFDRQSVYDSNSFKELLESNKFRVTESGSYFLKLFTHAQMDELLNKKIIDESVLDGLDRLIEFLPEMGAELWNISRIDD